MNGRSPLVTFFLFVFLAVLITLQFLSMIQSDRLYERLNDVVKVVERTRFRGPTASGQQEIASDEKYPGDEGDWLLYHLTGEPKTLNYFHSTSTMPTSYIVYQMILESLLEYDIDTFKMVKKLAESYEISDDGLEFTFKIREDACFSDGHPVQADDVIFTYRTIMNPEIDSADQRVYLNNIKDVVKMDERTVKFIMKEVSFKSLEYSGMMLIMPEHLYKFDDPKEFNDRVSDPAGSGPYVFEKWDVGNEVVLRRNENYWDKKPNIDKVVYRFITNDTAALQAFRKGDLDYMEPLPDQFDALKDDKEFLKKTHALSYWHPGVGYFWMGWNQDRPFFADRKVRMAMTHMIDRESICRDLLRNPDAKVPTGPFYTFGPQSDPDIKPWPYDPEKAKQLLDESGWIDTDGDGIRDKDGVPFSFKYMIVSGSYLHEQIGKLVKDSAAKQGIDVTLDPYEWSIFSEKVTDRKFDAVNMAWKAGLAGDPYQVWHSSQIGNRGSNYIGFNNPEADKIIEEARRTLDDDKRNKMYHRFHRILHEQQPYTFVYTRPGQRFLDKRFRNVKKHQLGLNMFEWYVPAALQKY